MGGRIGRFEMQGELGRGAFGAVFLARDPRRERPVALKLLVVDDPRAKARFQREVEAAARLRHPNLVEVLEHGEHGGRPFLVMDYVRGETLAEVALRERGISVTRAVELVRDAARGVAHAHAHGVLHRDLKPENVLIDSAGQPRVLDFGLAYLEAADRLSRTGAALGTPAYMAPEQGVGKPPTPRSDVYGLGATLYYALTRESPYEGELNPLLAAHRLDAPPPSARNPEVPPALDAIVARALARDPAARQAGAEELAAELDGFLAGQGAGARPARPAGRGRLLALAGLAALALVVAAWRLAAGRAPEAAPAASAAASSPTPPPLTTQEAEWERRFARALRADAPPAALEALRAELQRAGPATPRLARAQARCATALGLARARGQAAELAPAPALFATLDEARRAAEGDPVLAPRAALALVRAALHRNDPLRAALAEPDLAGEGGREGRLYLGILRLRGADTVAGARELEALAATQDRWGLLAAAHLAERRADAAEVERLTRAVVASWPGDPLAGRLQAAAGALASPGREAVEAFVPLTGAGAGRDDAALWISYALAALGASDLGRARACLERAGELCAPARPPAAELLAGLFALAEGRWTDARDALSERLRRDPADPRALLALGCALDELGKLEEATESYLRAQAAAPVGVPALLRRMTPVVQRLRIARALGLGPLGLHEVPAEAPARMERAYPRLPGPARAALIEAHLAASRGEPWERLAARIAPVVSAAPDSPALLRERAVMLTNRARFTEAAAEFAKLRALGERGPSLLLNEAENAYHQGESGRASQLFRELALGPEDDPAVLGAHAFGAFVNEDHRRALELSTRSLRLRALPFVGVIHALALHGLGRSAEARDFLARRCELVGFAHLWTVRIRADLAIANASAEDEAALEEAFAQQVALTCVVPDHPLAYDRCLERALLLPISHRLYHRFGEWMDRLVEIAAVTKSEHLIGRIRVFLGMSTLRLGSPKEKVLLLWRPWGGHPQAPEVPPQFLRVYQRTYGEPADLRAPQRAQEKE
ncbi:MAG: protein kinase [Planctomycetota bacterium]